MTEAVSLLSQYGPMAFGTVVLIAVWRLMLEPMVDRMSADTKVLAAEMKNAVDTCRSTAEVNRDTARVLSETSANLRSALEVMSRLSA